MIALIAAAAIMAGPVNLECQLTPDFVGTTPADAPWSYTVSLNEQEGRVDWGTARGSQSERAIFTANTVSWRIFSIDRRTLEFKRQSDLPGSPGEAVGRCRIARPVQRAF